MRAARKYADLSMTASCTDTPVGRTSAYGEGVWGYHSRRVKELLKVIT
jgi:hypothetical protein